MGGGREKHGFRETHDATHEKIFKHRPFVNFVKYFLPLWRRPREPRRNAVYFSKQHFYFSSARKRKGCRVMKDEKKGGGGRGEEFTLVVSMCTRVLLTQRKTWRMKRKKKIYITVVVCSLYIHTHTHIFSPRLFRDACSMWLL